MFYTYRQNNTGGRWLKEFPHYVIVEADTGMEANQIASDNGVDFEDTGCTTCGPRWSPKEEWEQGFEVPSIYSEGDIDLKKLEYVQEWSPEKDEHAVVLYKCNVMLKIDVIKK
jgi:hypothetical protein